MTDKRIQMNVIPFKKKIAPFKLKLNLLKPGQNLKNLLQYLRKNVQN